MISGIIFVIGNGLRWRIAPKDYGPHKTIYNRFIHMVQVNVPRGNVLTVGGESYELLQFHFHTPSENTIKGKRFPVEMHFVHQSAAGKLAVVAVMIESGGRTNPIDKLPIPARAGETIRLRNSTLNPIQL